MKEFILVEEREKVKITYIESAIMNKKAASEGDYKTANKQAKILNKITTLFETNKIEKSILVELLGNGNISVSCLAAIDLLRFRYEVQKAEKNLERIALLDETGMGVDEKLTVMAAQIQLKSWKEKGYVSR
jgi:hypothetical protein